jgi:hypothetical protein
MIELISSALLMAALASEPAIGHSPSRGMISASSAFLLGGRVTRAWASQQQPSSGDSLKNGAIIGALIGGAVGAAGGAISSCAVSVLAAPEANDCSNNNVILLGTVVGAGAGALLGVGIDALFERAPGFGMPLQQRRPIGLRLHVRF